jgi:hypothetical protein
LFKFRIGHELADNKKENLMTALYIGSIFIVLAVIYIIHLPSSLIDRLVDFFMSMTLASVPTTGIVLPAPSNPAAPGNIELYTAGFEFALAIGLIEVGILILRVLLHSPAKRKAETIENIVFWLGSSYLIITYLVNMTITAEWFVFWAGIIMIFGVALLARGLILLFQK